jgi:Rrf2 family protein
VKLRRGTRLGLYAALELARAGPGSPLTVASVAEALEVPAPVLSKSFQRLVRAGIAVGARGSGGGYRLAAPAGRVTLLAIVEAFEPVGRPGICLLADGGGTPCLDPSECVLRRAFDEIDEGNRATLASITLETLAGRDRGVRMGTRRGEGQRDA